MGFMDKVSAGVKNVDNRIGQGVDSAKYDSKISDQKNIKNKSLKEAGEKLFEGFLAGNAAVTDEIKALLEKAKACDEEIAKLEKEKEEMIAANKAERQANRDAADAASKKEE